MSSKGYLLISIAIIGWGASSPLIELGLNSGIAPIPFLTYRFLLASIILTPYVLLSRRDVFHFFKIPLVWLVGISEALGLIFQYLGQQQEVPAGLASLLSLLFLVIVPFISPFLLDEKLHPRHLLSVVIALIGVVLISSEGDIIGLFTGNVSMIGVIFLLLAAINYAFYIVFTSKVRTTDESVDTFGLFYAIMVIITILSALSSLLLGRFEPVTNFDFVGWLILLVIFSTLIAFVTYFEAMKTISANLASVLLLMQVFVAFILDFILIGNNYSLYSLAGSIVILFAMYIAVTTNSTDPSYSASKESSEGVVSSGD